MKFYQITINSGHLFKIAIGTMILAMILSLPTAPEIIVFAPASPASDVVGAARTFNIALNQTANVTWYINGTRVFDQAGVTESAYTNTTTIDGTWTYYVATTGNDTMGDGSRDNPWKTIQKAADTMVSGDTVKIFNGTYEENVHIHVSGTAGNEITYTTVAGDEGKVWVDGANLSAVWDDPCCALMVVNASYINISGIGIRNSKLDGLRAHGEFGKRTNITIYNVTVTNTSTEGIFLEGNETLVNFRNMTVKYCNITNAVNNNSGQHWGEFLDVKGTDGFEIAYNHVADNLEGYAKRGDAAGGGEGIDATGDFNGTIHDNIVHHVTRVGIYVSTMGVAAGNIKVYNNLVYNVTIWGWGDGIDVETEGKCPYECEVFGIVDNVSVYNNVVSGNRSLVIRAQNVTVSSNTFDNLTYVYENEYADTKNITIRNTVAKEIFIDPLVPAENVTKDHNWETDVQGAAGFINPAPVADGGNYHLTADSPLRDAGTATGAPETDYDGIPRPQFSGYDIGAYEYTLSTFFRHW